MAVPIRIQHLLWAGSAVTALGCLILGGTLIAASLGDFRRADRAVAELARFRLIVVAAQAVSAERGPANSAMDPAAGEGAELDAALAAKRAVTDREVRQMRGAFAEEIVGSPALRAQLETMDDHLAGARAAVDAVRATPSAQRSGTAIARAIEAMFAVADDVMALRNDLGRSLIRNEPRLGTAIMLQSCASTMREQAGRLGSYAVMLLAGGIAEAEGRAAFDRSAGRILQLWMLLSSFGPASIEADAVHPALHAVEEQYFGGSWRIARETLDTPGMRTIGAAAFTRLYVPGLDAASRLGDSVAAVSFRRLERRRTEAFVRTLVSGSLTGLVVLVLAALALVFRNRLFRPLLAAREEILAIARDDLSDPRRAGRAGREIREMFDGLTVLREQQRHRRVLERERQRMTRQLRVLSETDALTGLLNRRALCERGRQILDDADRRSAPVGLILFDIDHFKAVNDTHGHAVGDLVLREIGARLRPLLRTGDLIARYGGEEFLIVLPDLRRPGIEAVAERMRVTLAAKPFGEAHGLSVTGSFGIAARRTGSGLDWETLVGLADRGLYRAKRTGRNRVCALDTPDCLHAPPAMTA